MKTQVSSGAPLLPFVALHTCPACAGTRDSLFLGALGDSQVAGGTAVEGSAGMLIGSARLHRLVACVFLVQDHATHDAAASTDAGAIEAAKCNTQCASPVQPLLAPRSFASFEGSACRICGPPRLSEGELTGLRNSQSMCRPCSTRHARVPALPSSLRVLHVPTGPAQAQRPPMRHTTCAACSLDPTPACSGGWSAASTLCQPCGCLEHFGAVHVVFRAWCRTIV